MKPFYEMRRESWPVFVCALLALLYCTVFAVNSLTRYRSFSPDSMNYVDVARNVSAGRGLVQSAIGFNHPRFLGDRQWPEPFTAQPPLFPLLVSGLAAAGIDHADGALLVPALCHALLLLLAARLGWRLGGMPAALAATAVLAWFFPLRFTCRCAWSESLAMIFILHVLSEVSPPSRMQSFSVWRWALLGLAAGLAFATRYAMAPLVLLAAACAVYAMRKGTAVRSLFYFFAGLSTPVAAVLVHNIGATGHLLPVHNVSDQPWTGVLRDILATMFGQYNESLRGPLAWCGSIFAVGIAVLIAFRVRKSERDFRWAPVAIWTAGYLAFIFLQRVRIHFDDIGPRMLLPALLPAAVAWAAVVSRVIPARWAAGLCALALCGATAGEWQAWRARPPVDEAQRDASIARNVIARKLTTDRDVIIGNDPLGVVFYLRRPNVISFSKWPYTDAPVYNDLIAFLDRFADRYDRAFILLREVTGGSRAIAERDYGPFIADLLAGKTGPYPRIEFVGGWADTRVFAIRKNMPSAPPAAVPPLE